MSINKYVITIFCITTLSVTSLNTFAQSNETKSAQQVIFSQAELAQILAPIALYPDVLLTHILIAATYPLEVIQAQRYLENNPDLDKNEIALRVANKDWDASVKALMGFPNVLKRLSDDLQWTQKLGDAFLANEAQVLASIQTLRLKAEQAGNLDNMDNVNIIREQKIIIIEPARPEVIYVPYYDTRYVYGDWHWRHYPPIYWEISQYNRYYRAAHSPFYWHSGVHISFNFFFSAFHWSERHIVVTNYHNTRRHYSYGRLVKNTHARRWQHNPVHRRGVAYSTGHLKQRFHSNRPSLHERKIVRSGGYQKGLTHQYVARNAQTKGAKPHVNRKVITKHQQVTQKLKNPTSYKKEAIRAQPHKKFVKPAQANANYRNQKTDKMPIEKKYNSKRNTDIAHKKTVTRSQHSVNKGITRIHKVETNITRQPSRSYNQRSKVNAPHSARRSNQSTRKHH